MKKNMQQLKKYLDSAHSVYHAVEQLKTMLTGAGYTCLQEADAWKIAPGGKYFVTRGDSALVAFRIPEATPTGFMLTASHGDRPGFKLKENGESTDQYTRLATEKYGGMLISTWLDRPLSVAGRVVVETENGVRSCLLDVDKDLMLIPNVAIHMNRNANEGYKWNPAVDTLPLLGGKEAAGKLWEQLEQLAGGKILGHDLYLYVRQQASVWGVGEEYISAAGLDDLLCAWCCARGFLAATPGSAIPVLCVFDSEEVGSASVQGAGSTFLEDILQRVSADLGLELPRLLRNSFLLSVDNAHALHPNHPELSDGGNAPIPGGGIVLKFNANQSYTTDGVAAALVRKICQKAHVPVQTYYNRADLPGGSTLGRISLGHVSVLSADIGLAQLAMHSCYETAAVADVDYLEATMEAFYSCSLDGAEDHTVKIV